MKERLEIVRQRAQDLLRRLAALRRKPEVEPPSPDEDPASGPAAPGEPEEAPTRFPLAQPSISRLKERVLSVAKRLRRTVPQKPAEPAEEPAAPEPKLPPEPPLFFMLSHVEDDGPVRLDNVKVGVCEVMGMEIDEPKLGAFAGALNALDFPVQLLIRQHPPRLGRLREKLREAQPDDLPPQTRAASESLQRLLGDLEKRDGILDRRFYAVCESARIDELRGLLARAGLSIHLLRGRQLRMFLASAALGGSPADVDESEEIEVEINRRDMRIGDRHGPLPAPGPLAPVAGPRLPAGADGRRCAYGPGHPRRPHSGGAGGEDPGVAEGEVRVGPVPLLQAGPHHVAGG